MQKILVVLLLALASCATDSHTPVAGSSDSPLYGRWRNVETKIHRADGTTTTQTELECVIEITRTHAISDCSLADGRKARVVSKIVSLTPTLYELEIVENATVPRTVGLRSRVDYRIVGNRLYRIVYPPPEGTSPPKSPVVQVDTIYERE